jgi:hypothetical protein
MFVLKTIIEEDMPEHIQDATAPREAWDTLASFSSNSSLF